MNGFSYPPGATPLDPDELIGLKLVHITTRRELDRWEQDNIQEAMSWLERKRKSNVLDEKFIRQLHQRMFNKIWAWAGDFRRTDKNIGGSWTMIPIDLRNLLDDVKFWISAKTFTPDEIAFRFHHRLVLIHLFPNGNGRHARLITDTLLTEVLNEESFTWGSGDLNNPGDVRKKYIDALRAADQQNYELLQLFVRS